MTLPSQAMALQSFATGLEVAAELLCMTDWTEVLQQVAQL